MKSPPLTLLAATLAVAGCASGSNPQAGSDDEGGLIPQVPVPAAEGPKLVALVHHTVVRDRPSASGKAIGHLRAGGRVARAAEPYSRKGCPGGWYPVRPRGFVCAGVEASTDLDAPIARVLAAEPSLERALPYRYGQVVGTTAVAYTELPSAAEQQAAEPELAKRKPGEPEPLGLGANDVPLTDAGLPKGPPILLPDAEGVGADGRRTTESFFAFPAPAAPAPPLADGFSLLPKGTAAPAPGRQVLRRGSTVAIAGALEHRTRRFGVLPDGRLVPTDQLRPLVGTSWHGIDLAETGLPVAFALREGVRPRSFKGNKAEVLDDEYEPREAIPLTGRFRTVDSIRYFCTRDERWLRAKDIILIPKRNKFPEWVAGGQKWLDISLANQTLTAFVGTKPVYATLISSGADRLGDPAAGPATVQGVFRVRGKHLTRDVDEREVQQAFSVFEAPWALDFADGFSITGSYWRSRFGEAQGYHNVSLAPIDAHWLWTWTELQLPEGWHGVVVDEQGAETTIVYTHK
ncbi:MAG: L,D-transpeptidase [Deltaproteobacteria bacterium]|nr:L,D-transpeptidase [Deltaproteobacteria bacterium]